MPINVPHLDDRNYADIVRDALARIPVHNPEWTNFNDSDPGVTLLQVFAFMTESILYRANQIPERNRLKFLQLLGIPLLPAAPAEGFVTISNDRGPLVVRTFNADLDVRAGQVQFRTTQGLDVLPIAAQLFYKRSLQVSEDQQTLYQNLYSDLLGTENTELAFYETALMPRSDADGTLPVLDLGTTVDGCLWIALLARTAAELASVRSQLVGKTLTVGVMPYLEEEGLTVAAGQTERAEVQETAVRWEIADASTNEANYRPLRFRSEGSVFNAPGLVELSLPSTEAELTAWNFTEPGDEGTGEYPPSLADSNLGNRLITWIRLRLDNAMASTANARLSWVGINATQVRQRSLVGGEVVGTGTGEPDQSFRLANTPVLPETLILKVGNDPEPWQQINDLLAADPEVPVGNPRRPIYVTNVPTMTATSQTKVFTLDAESGAIAFGDGAHGARPTGRIVANYAFGGGRQGNVGIGSINRSPQLPAGYTVTNPIRTWGGDDAQDVAIAEKSIARYVKHRDRLVSVEDFIDVTQQTPGVDIGRVAILPLFDPNLFDATLPETQTIPGAITVMVIPASPNNDNPLPDQFFLEAVCRHLQPRRLVTTELHIRGPKYVDIWVSVAIEVLNGYAAAPVREAVKEEIYRFLSPLYGGQQGQGWLLNTPVRQAELEAIVARVAGVRLVNDPLLLGTATVSPLDKISFAGLELPRLAGVSVVSGVGSVATPIDELRNAPSVTAPPVGDRWIPIPVIPEQC
jgi:hypothetical protein